MENFKVGDFVSRKSYNGDIDFIITDISSSRSGQPVYILRGVLYRIEADCSAEDLVKRSAQEVWSEVERNVLKLKRYTRERGYTSRPFPFVRLRAIHGKILHIDSSESLMDMCIKHYRESKLNFVTYLASESSQPGLVRRLLEKHRPDILVVTGHDGIRKGSKQMYSLDSYRNSKYFVESVREARKYQPSYDKLCIFAGACQSFYEAIMEAGANFASSPGRILINGLDPGIVSEKIAVTDSRTIVTPREISRLTISGARGIGGINTRGRSKAQ